MRLMNSCAEVDRLKVCDGTIALHVGQAHLDEVLAPYDAVLPPDLWKSPEIWAVVGYGGYALATGQDPVFCPAGPTSLQALVVAKALTTLVLAGWAVYVAQAAAKAAAPAKPQ